ncbi:MAG: hypothetical protein JWP06_732 [Candidatus Saccharibacteria bacterium]|nr:hypothetical protein [Candidatus Saccharibacteria bacterium]
MQSGSLAQLVEQGLEEPCVPSSSLGGATKESTYPSGVGIFFCWDFHGHEADSDGNSDGNGCRQLTVK